MRWPVPSEAISVSPSFLYGLYSFIPSVSKTTSFSNLLTNSQVLSSLYNHYAKQSSQAIVDNIKQNNIKTVIPCFFRDHYNVQGFLTETCIFCPLTVFQSRCLQALLKRWDFALASPSSDRVSDVTANVLFEMLRIYTHPILGGCSESLLQEAMKTDWATAFKRSSSKVMVCDYLIQSYQAVHSSFLLDA